MNIHLHKPFERQIYKTHVVGRLWPKSKAKAELLKACLNYIFHNTHLTKKKKKCKCAFYLSVLGALPVCNLSIFFFTFTFSPQCYSHTYNIIYIVCKFLNIACQSQKPKLISYWISASKRHMYKRAQT